MPNWCNNSLIISHPDPAIMEKAAAAWNKGEFLATFVLDLAIRILGIVRLRDKGR